MKYSRVEFIVVILVYWLSYCNIIVVSGKSVKIRTAKPKLTPQVYNYHKAKPQRKPVHSSQFVLITQKGNGPINRQSEFDILEPNNGGGESGQQDVIQNTFNTGLRDFFRYLRNVVSRYLDPGVESEGSTLRIPGFPTTPILQHLDVSSIVKIFEATDASQAQALAEAAVLDIVSQLVREITFDELRDWLDLVLMYFVLGPILIPLFWLPISLFGMVGLLAPLFFFNPPSKLNTNVMGHDPLPVEQEAVKIAEAKRSLDSFLYEIFNSSSSALKQFATMPASSSDIIESCMERVSCHFTRLYRDNPVSQWLTSRFNTTKVEWARLHPEDDINGNGISSWEDCKKYACSLLPAA